MSSSQKSPMSFLQQVRSHAFLLSLAGGVLISFTIYGYAQEALTRGSFGGERFKFPTFLILVMSLSNMLTSAVLLLKNKDPDWASGAPTKDWVLVSAACLGAHYFGLWALAFIPFPLQVVCKSCKPVPVMLGEWVIVGVNHSWEKKMQVLLMVFGVVIFTLTGGNKKGNKGNDDWALTPSFFLGIALVCGALVCDGIYGPYQSKIKKQFSAKNYHNMWNMGLWEFVMAVGICMFTGELQDALAFMGRHPEVVSKIFFFGVTFAPGSLFIFSMQEHFGSLTVTLTTTLRKLISVVFSVLWFGHTLQPAQWAAAILVFASTEISKYVCGMLGLASTLPASSGEEKKEK